MELKRVPDSSHTELLHPGRDAAFSEFMSFIKVEDPELKEKFIQVLRELFVATPHMWAPGSCYSTQEFERIIKRIQAQGALAEVTLTPMRWSSTHFFLTARLKDSEKTLIVDPFGVPTVSEHEYMKNMRLITPFFGEIQLAPPKHQRIYSDAEPLGERGYRTFHP